MRLRTILRFFLALHADSKYSCDKHHGGTVREVWMPEQTLQGSCLCKSVRYEVSTPFMRFGHCYCSRCRKATGGVRSTNIAVPIGQFH